MRRAVKVYGVVLFLGVFFGAGAGIVTAGWEVNQRRQSGLENEGLLRFISPYPGTVFEPLGSELHVDGKGRELAYALSDHSPETIATWYGERWESEGLRVRQRQVGEERVVVGSDLLGGRVRTVVITTHGEEMIGGDGFSDDRKTVLVASVSEAFEERRAPRAPLPGFCEVRSYTGGRDQGVRTELLFLGCKGYLREVIQFYDREFEGAARREPLKFGPGSPSAHITFNTPTTGLVLSAVAQEGDTPRVAVTLSWQERR